MRAGCLERQSWKTYLEVYVGNVKRIYNSKTKIEQNSEITCKFNVFEMLKHLSLFRIIYPKCLRNFKFPNSFIEISNEK